MNLVGQYSPQKQQEKPIIEELCNNIEDKYAMNDQNKASSSHESPLSKYY